MRSPSGRNSNDRLNALKRGSIRGMQGLMNGPYGSGSGFSSEGRISPTSSFGTLNTESGFAATIGFASNLSHTVIREHDDEKESMVSEASADTTDDELNDDELALLGAPWAKEGMVWRRAGSDAAMRKVSKKDWKQYFGVVQRGEMLLFTFGEGSGSGSMGAVGGGNWLVGHAARW
jgi:PH/SEC7 domain-containing protein